MVEDKSKSSVDKAPATTSTYKRSVRSTTFFKHMRGYRVNSNMALLQ